MQKAIALSSGKSEFVAVVAGCSDGMLIKHLLNKMTGGNCMMKVRTDSSAARSMVQRQGIGRVRHSSNQAIEALKQKDPKPVQSAQGQNCCTCNQHHPADVSASFLKMLLLLGSSNSPLRMSFEFIIFFAPLLVWYWYSKSVYSSWPTLPPTTSIILSI